MPRVLDSRIDLRVLLYYYSQEMTGWNRRGLSSPFWRFYWNDRGGNFMYLDGRTWELTPRRCFVIPAGTPFDARSANPVNHLHVHFTLGPPYHSPQPAIYQLEVDSHTRRLIDESVAYFEEGEPDEGRLPVLAHALVFGALARLPELEPDTRAEEPRMRRVHDFMDSYQYMVSNEVLAREAGMSTNAFIRWFGSHTGRSPQAYAMSRRIDRACELLLYSENTIERIAEECGFCDRHYFSRMFRKVRGISPAAFRRHMA